MKRKHDYPHTTNPDDYFTTVPDSEELCEIAASTDIGIAGSAEGTVFPTSIKQTKKFTFRHRSLPKV